MKLWGGRFAKETNEMVDEFNACIGFGSRLYEQDILGSIAHATMLGEQNIIPQEDAAKIVEGLKGILADAKAGKIQWSTEAEDIHKQSGRSVTSSPAYHLTAFQFSANVETDLKKTPLTAYDAICLQQQSRSVNVHLHYRITAHS